MRQFDPRNTGAWNAATPVPIMRRLTSPAQAAFQSLCINWYLPDKISQSTKETRQAVIARQQDLLIRRKIFFANAYTYGASAGDLWRPRIHDSNELANDFFLN